MAKKKGLKDKVKDLEKDFKEQFTRYQQAQEKLASYAGKEWTEIGKNNVNKMLKDIQDNFFKLYPIIEFIQGYATPANTILQSYVTFVKELKAQGVVVSKDPKVDA